MGFGDKFKDLAKQAQDAVAERKEQISGAVDRATVVADQRTGGKYSEQIAKAGQKATGVVEKLAGDTDASTEPPPSGQEAAPAAGEPSTGHVPTEPAPGSTAPPDFQ
jgi:hypothetical protein